VHCCRTGTDVATATGVAVAGLQDLCQRAASSRRADERRRRPASIRARSGRQRVAIATGTAHRVLNIIEVYMNFIDFLPWRS
jgi:hypothetical protein